MAVGEKSIYTYISDNENKEGIITYVADDEQGDWSNNKFKDKF